MAEFSELEILRTDGDFFLNEIRKKFALRVLGEWALCPQILWSEAE